MNIRSDFSLREVVRPADHHWVPSPAPGVQRVMLDRIGDEVARATSLVRFDARTSFPFHVHGGGEEFLVLSGTFEDESGAYGEGTYVRNPPGSAHAPMTLTGCTLFVKLHQFDPEDLSHTRINSQDDDRWVPGIVEGLSVLPLHSFAGEHVALVRWAPGTVFRPHTHFGGEEILVLDGTFSDEHGDYPRGTWIRSPHGSRHHPWSNEGCTIYVKTGHLPIATQGAS